MATSELGLWAESDGLEGVAVDDHCIVCNAPPAEDEPAVPEEYYPGAWCHRSCLNAPAGIAWRARRSAQDPGFARWNTLSGVGRRVACAACGGEAALSAKARGMGAGSWEACCRSCCAVTILNGYAHPAEYDALQQAEQRFLRSADDTSWREDIARLAQTTDPHLDRRRCDCGDRFSLAAEPRCPHCRAVLLESFFHYADSPS